MKIEQHTHSCSTLAHTSVHTFLTIETMTYINSKITPLVQKKAGII